MARQGITFAAVFLSSVILAQIVPTREVNEVAITKSTSELEVLNVQFEPIRQGKNVVHVNVKNNSNSEQIFRIHIYTRSPDYGKKGVGWGMPFYDTLKPGESKLGRFVYKIQGPVTENTYIKLSFSNPESVEQRNAEPFNQQKYLATQLKRYDASAVETKVVNEDTESAVVDAFRRLQAHVKNKEYDKAWDLFSSDYKKSEFQVRGFEAFTAAMEPKQPIDAAFHWNKDIFVQLKVIQSMRQINKAVTFEALFEGHEWTLTFVPEDGQWKLDDIVGYVPLVLAWQDWENRVLPTVEKHSTEHFDFYYFKDSTAARQIEKIAEQKEQGYKQICEFLDKKTDVRIRLVFFEDKKSKHWMTGHQGMGWAYGNTMVEVYSEKERLDPYHETTHVLMKDIGSPPALFNEGFAVYMSERLGEHALKNLGGGEAMIYERLRQLNEENKLIPLEQLLTYTEIGSIKSQPPVAYPEAASFVKFLIETHGKDKFLQAYSQLYNSSNKTVQQQNLEKLEKVYGQSLEQLEKHWRSAFMYSPRTQSKENLERLWAVMEVYANDNQGYLPEVLQNLNPYVEDKDYFEWLKSSVVYLGTGRQLDKQDTRPIAYDKKLLQIGKDATAALLNGGKVHWVQAEALEDLRTREQKQRESKYDFAIFIVETPIRSYGLNLIHPDILQLSAEPVFSSKDVISYDWASHTITLQQSVNERLPRRVPVAGLPFVVVANGTRCYIGAFWTGISSIPSPVPTVMVQDVVALPEAITVQIQRAYPSGAQQQGDDPRNDMRVHGALRRIGKLASEPRVGEILNRQPVGQSLRERLESTVDLSELSPDMGFGKALEILKNSVEPPLNILVLWRELYENADIDRDTPINMDPLAQVKLETALKLLLHAVGAGFIELGYVVDDGLVVVATKETTAKWDMKTKLYDITDLAQPRATHRSQLGTTAQQ